MRILFDCFIILVIGLVIVGTMLYSIHRNPVRSAPDRCKHRRWTPWVIIKEVPIHLYSELDEGRGLPDRVDTQMERECATCHIRQVQTVRGIDSQHHK